MVICSVARVGRQADMRTEIAAPISRRRFFSLWKRSAIDLECKNHRAMFFGNSDSKVVAKAERNEIPAAAFDVISHEYLTQCGGLKGRGTDIANLAVRCVFATWEIKSRYSISTYVDIFMAFYAAYGGPRGLMPNMDISESRRLGVSIHY